MTTLDNGLKSFFGQATTFVPTDIPDMNLWLDAQDTSTLTAPAARVSDWDSKVGAFSFTQGTLLNRPLLDPTGINGFQSVYFDGAVTTKSLLGNLSYAGNTAVTIYIVGKLVTVTPALRAVLGSVAGDFIRVRASSGALRFEWNGGSGLTAWQTPTPMGTAAARRVCIELDLSGPNAAIAGTIDNLPLAGGYTTGPNPVGVPGPSIMQLGASGALGMPLNGHVGEILVYAGLHDAATRTLVDNYLKTKWGL
jgi:hypothetical protein